MCMPELFCILRIHLKAQDPPIMLTSFVLTAWSPFYAEPLPCSLVPDFSCETSGLNHTLFTPMVSFILKDKMPLSIFSMAIRFGFS